MTMTASAGWGDYPLCGTPTVISISGTSTATGSALTAGRYLLYATVECAWRQGTAPVAVFATDVPCPAGTLVPVRLQELRLAAITQGGSGSLYIIPVQ